MRQESSKEVTIVWRPFATYGIYAFIVVMLLASLVNIPVFTAASFLLFFANSIYSIAECSAPRKEINKATQHGVVSVSGNKFSFTEPLIVRISKSCETTVDNSIVDHVKTNHYGTGRAIRKVLSIIGMIVFALLGWFFLQTGINASIFGVGKSGYLPGVIILFTLSIVFFCWQFYVLKRVNDYYDF